MEKLGRRAKKNEARMTEFAIADENLENLQESMLAY